MDHISNGATPTTEDQPVQKPAHPPPPRPPQSAHQINCFPAGPRIFDYRDELNPARGVTAHGERDLKRANRCRGGRGAIARQSHGPNGDMAIASGPHDASCKNEFIGAERAEKRRRRKERTRLGSDIVSRTGVTKPGDKNSVNKSRPAFKNRAWTAAESSVNAMVLVDGIKDMAIDGSEVISRSDVNDRTTQHPSERRSTRASRRTADAKQFATQLEAAYGDVPNPDYDPFDAALDAAEASITKEENKRQNVKQMLKEAEMELGALRMDVKPADSGAEEAEKPKSGSTTIKEAARRRRGWKRHEQRAFETSLARVGGLMLSGGSSEAVTASKAAGVDEADAL